MADLTALEAIEKRIVESGRPMTRAEASTLAPLRIKRRKDEEANKPKPKSRAEAANIARIGAEKYNELREMSNNPPAPPRTRAEAATYMKNRQMATAAPVPAIAPSPAPVEAPVAAPVAATAPQDDIRSMIEATGNALSAAPVADEQPATQPMGNVSTQIEAPAAKPVIDEARMASLFRKTTGTDFNPKSRVDKERMSQLTSFIEQDPTRLDKSDTRIALDFYKTL